MNSRRISQIKKLQQILLVVGVCLVVLFLLPKLFNGAVALIAAPINATKTWAAESSSSLPQYFRNRSELLKEISELRSQVASSNGGRFTLEALVKENDTLRSLLGDDGEERVVAGVISRPGVLPYDAIMIDKGTDDGVLNGAPVYIGENTVIGIVKNATAKTALIELITTPGFETTVYIIGPDIYTNAIGVGGGQMRVGVPQGITLSEGDLVVLPSVTSGVYGEINLVQSEATRPEQYGYVSPDTPIASIRLVSIGKTPLHSVSFEEAQMILSEIKETVFTVPVPDEILVDTNSSSTPSTTNEINHEE